MSDKESSFLKSLRNYLIGTGITIIFALVGFYFRTNFKINELDRQIQKIEESSVNRLEYDSHVIHQDYVDNEIIRRLEEMSNDIKAMR